MEGKKLDLVKRLDTYKIIIPDSVENTIRFLCSKVWNVEWSGILFYKVEGNFKDNNLVVRCVDILPMDIGNATYTEFDQSPDAITYAALHPELLDCFTGLIHSHNNMSTFLSGTDTATLQSEGSMQPHFVSLIVNNEGKYTAAITRRITYSEKRTIEYPTFGGGKVTEEEEFEETSEIEYFMLNVEFETAKESFQEISDRLEGIKKRKAEEDAKKKALATSQSATTYNSYKTPTSTPNPHIGNYNYGTYKDPTAYGNKDSVEAYKSWEDSYPFGDSPLVGIEEYAEILIYGNTFLPTAFDVKKFIPKMEESFKKRFKTFEEYEDWISCLVDEMMLDSLDSEELWSPREFIESLKSVILSYGVKNKYIDTIISCLNVYLHM